MNVRSITRLASLLALLAVGTVYAAPKEGDAKAGSKTEAKGEAKGEGKAKTKRDTYPFYGEVVAVSARMLTIKGGEGKEDRKFTILADTKIHNDGKPATIADIKTGKMVGGSVKKTEGDVKDQLASINIGVKQDRSAPEKKGDAAKPSAESKTKGKKE